MIIGVEREVKSRELVTEIGQCFPKQESVGGCGGISVRGGGHNGMNYPTQAKGGLEWATRELV